MDGRLHAGASSPPVTPTRESSLRETAKVSCRIYLHKKESKHRCTWKNTLPMSSYRSTTTRPALWCPVLAAGSSCRAANFLLFHCSVTERIINIIPSGQTHGISVFCSPKIHRLINIQYNSDILLLFK